MPASLAAKPLFFGQYCSMCSRLFLCPTLVPFRQLPTMARSFSNRAASGALLWKSEKIRCFRSTILHGSMFTNRPYLQTLPIRFSQEAIGAHLCQHLLEDFHLILQHGNLFSLPHDNRSADTQHSDRLLLLLFAGWRWLSLGLISVAVLWCVVQQAFARTRLHVGRRIAAGHLGQALMPRGRHVVGGRGGRKIIVRRLTGRVGRNAHSAAIRLCCKSQSNLFSDIVGSEKMFLWWIRSASFSNTNDTEPQWALTLCIYNIHNNAKRQRKNSCSCACVRCSPCRRMPSTTECQNCAVDEVR